MSKKLPGQMQTPHGFLQEYCIICQEGSHRHWWRRFGPEKQHCSCDHHTSKDFLERAEELVERGEHALADEFRKFAAFLDKSADSFDKPVALCIRQTFVKEK